ncbi:MAG: PEGA domain-containing protein [Methanoregula sp.]|uniref:PEGA domain-containing protein n=1 Tax=Methanoregula sp. TaxID=2052170 RepID=UPI003C720CA4
MSRGRGSSVISVTVFLAILLIVLPVSAENVTAAQTTVITPQTSVTTSPTTIATQPTNVTTSPTTVATTVTTATPVNTTVTVTQPTTVVTTIQPTVYATEAPNTGSVSVYSSPTGASILIDGLYCGTTPNTVTDVAAGNHLLQLELSGYTNYEGSIYVVAGQTAEGYGTLQPIEGTSAMLTPATNATVPVVAVVVTVAPEPTQDTGLLGNSTVLAAIISSITVLVVSGISLYIHFTSTKKKE